MTAKNTKERLAVIEEQLKQNRGEHKEFKQIVESIDKKLTSFIATAATKDDLKTKADKEDFEAVKENQRIMNTRLWGLLITFLVMLIGTLGWALRQLYLAKLSSI